MNKEILLAVMLGVLLWCGVGSFTYEATAEPGRGQPPVILDSYAAKVIRPGATWRVYLQAKDDDGDMKEFSAVLWQTGVGYYTTEFIRIKADDSRELAGYIYLTTPVDQALNNDRLELKITVRDKKRNKSETAEFPLKFDFVPLAKLPEKWQKVADRRLGGLMAEITGSSSGPRGGFVR